MHPLRRGFKTESKQIAQDERRALGLDHIEPYDPYFHAEQWGIRVVSLRSVGCGNAALQHFIVDDPSAFSGMLIPDGKGYVILENDGHDFLRRRSTAAHEMAHVLLEHDGDVLLSLGNECRSSSSSLLEAEAAELAGELLIPTESALRVARRNWTDEQVAEQFEVSLRMASWRMNASGSRKRARNEQRRRAGVSV